MTCLLSRTVVDKHRMWVNLLNGGYVKMVARLEKQTVVKTEKHISALPIILARMTDISLGAVYSVNKFMN